MPLITRIDTLPQQPSQEALNDLIVLVANKLALWVKTFMRTGRIPGRYATRYAAEAAATQALLDAGASPEAVRWCFRVLPQGFGQTYQEKGEVYADNTIAFARRVADTSVPVEVEQVHLNAGGKASLRVRVEEGPLAGHVFHRGIQLDEPAWRWPFVHAGLPVPTGLGEARVLQGHRLGARVVEVGGHPRLERWVSLRAATRPWAADEAARKPTGPWDPVLAAMTERGIRIDVEAWARAIEVHRTWHRLPAANGDKAAMGSLDALAYYADRVLEAALADPDHRVHPTWRTQTWTTRIGAFDPAIQNVTKRTFPGPLGSPVERVGDLRAAVVPAPGHLFVVADWSHAQLRIAAGISGDPHLLADIAAGDLYERLGTGILDGAAAIYGETPTPRAVGKRLALAILFGAGAAKLVETAAKEDVVVTVLAAMQVLDAWWGRYKVLNKYRNDHASLSAFQTSLGTKVYVPPGKWNNRGPILAGIIQALEADALRVVLALSDERMARTGAVPVLQNRDEVVWQVRIEHAVEAAERAEKLMLETMSRVCAPCPAEVEVEIRRSWSAADRIDVPSLVGRRTG